jgi:hypothetical protein
VNPSHCRIPSIPSLNRADHRKHRSFQLSECGSLRGQNRGHRDCCGLSRRKIRRMISDFKVEWFWLYMWEIPKFGSDEAHRLLRPTDSRYISSSRGLRVRRFNSLNSSPFYEGHDPGKTTRRSSPRNQCRILLHRNGFGETQQLR